MLRKWYIIVLAVMAVIPEIKSQEVITGTFMNPLLSENHHKSSTKNLKSTPVSLPFYDDFSYEESYPDSQLWSDSYVFINNTYSNNQYTQGMATFDAIDQSGALYPDASYAIFAADTLTSQPINLMYLPSDSIYLSFLYEPGGLGDLPETNDSLKVQFYNPSGGEWKTVWLAKGGGDRIFNLAMIRITDSKYLTSGFRFRFINYASLASATTEPARAGNADHWNIDCVTLDKNRTRGETVMHDVAFTTPMRSLLNNMEAMPWNQFKKAYLTAMGSVLTVNYRNNDDIIRNSTRSYTITDLYNDLLVKESLPTAKNTDPFTDDLLEESLIYTFASTSPDSALFLITSVLKTDDFDPKENDTIRFYQFFGDYFAYDDGTAEAGYGINGEGSDNAMVALRFRSFTQDSVSGLRICFNDAVNNANQRYFYMMAWADDDGKPGEIIAQSDELLAMPSENNNGFVTFSFDKPVYTDSYFWVGWKQASETFLNVGLDMNTPHQNRLWYWINGNWYASAAPGTILLRPVMTGEGSGSGIEDEEDDLSSQFSLFPNPAQRSFSVTGPGTDAEKYRLAVYNLAGAVVLTSDSTSDVDISHLAGGTYLVVVKSSLNKPVAVLKLIKSR